MDSLPPIPTPPAQRWREFRIQVLPLLVFIAIVSAIVIMWRNFVQPAGVVGEVEAIKANVISLQDGVLADLNFDRFMEVGSNDPVAQVVVVDPDLHKASLAVIAADLKLMKARMDVDKTRNYGTYAQLQLELLSEKLLLNMARPALVQAETELKRNKQLFDEKLIPAGVGIDRNQYGYEVYLRDCERLKLEMQDRTNRIAHLEQAIQKMEATGIIQVTPEDQAIQDDINAQQEQLRLSEKPLFLKAPIGGVVSAVFKRPGEKVVRGEPIMTISAPAADHIIGYLRQPIPTIPTTNDSVMVCSRTAKRQMVEAKITKVGAQFELINPVLLSPDGKRMEMGLPFQVELPQGMRLAPGEVVDLSLRYAKR